MASLETSSTSHSPTPGQERDGPNDPVEDSDRTRSTTEVPAAKVGSAGKSLLGARTWLPPHLLHCNNPHQLQNVHPQEHHQHRIHLNPLQYLHHESRLRTMNDLRKPPSISTTAPPSPVNCDSPHSPFSRPSSKDSSPISFYQLSDHGTLYHPPYLHFTHQQPVKETHRLDLDFDPVSGRKSINKYEIIDEIGRGTHGKVKLGRNLTSDEYVAIKIVERHSRPRLGKVIREEDEKVRREIAILKKCRHPNVVRLIEVIDDPASKKVYLVLEYVELGEIAWRKLGPSGVLRRERNRLKNELTGGCNEGREMESGKEERIRMWRPQRQRKLQGQKKHVENGRSPTASPDTPKPYPQPDENPNFWSLELGGLSEEEYDATDDDYLSAEDDDPPAASIVDAPYLPPLDSDSEEPSHHISSMSLIALGSNPDSPPYSFSHGDLQYVPALTFEQARSTFRDTVLGLEYLHYHGIIHRDIKPANLLWTKNYRVKISDFGVSYLGRGSHRADEGGGDKGQRRTKRDQVSGRGDEVELAKTVGTPAFFAPELCFFDSSKPRPHITSAIDVWALGVTLYCLIFARCPFLADDEFELFHVIAKQELFIPKHRIRPLHGYSAPAKSLPRLNSSSRPRSMHHQRITFTKKVAVHDPPMPARKGIGVSEEQETEVIPDELRTLLEALLTKDPTKRITIKEVKQHPWVLQDFSNPAAWLEATDPERVSGGGRIEVNEEEMEKAVVPASWTTGVIRHVKTGFNKLRQKMGMGGNVSDSTAGKKEKVGLHPLASRVNEVKGSSFEVANWPRSGSSSSTLHDRSEVFHQFSLSVQTSSPYNLPRVAAPPPALGGVLTSPLNLSLENSISESTNSNTPPKDDRLFTISGYSNTSSPMKKFLNHSQSSLANSLSRSLSRSSYHSERTATSDSTFPNTFSTKDRRDRMLPSALLRRTRSTLTSGESNTKRRHISEEMGMFRHRGVRKAISSSLGQEIMGHPSPSSQSTIKQFPSSSQELSTKDQIPAMRLPTVSSGESARVQLVQQTANHKNGNGVYLRSTTTATLSRRCSSSSTSNSVTHAHDGVAAALGGLFGRGKRAVRSINHSRDTWASEPDAMMSTSGGSGDDERGHRRRLRISMLQRKGGNGVEACQEVSRVNVSCARSGNSTAATSPMGESEQGYFDTVYPAAPVSTGSRCTPSIRTISESTTTFNIMATTSASSNALSYHPSDARGADRRRYTRGYELYDTSCPPSPDDYTMWGQQVKACDRREALRKEQENEMAQELNESLNRVGNGIAIQRPLALSPHCWQPEKESIVQLPSYSQHHEQSEGHSPDCTPDTDGNLISSSSEKMRSQQVHRHTDTAASSLTESNSFPSIQSMIESSAASSVSADGGWPVAAESTNRVMTVTSANLDGFLNGNCSGAEDNMTPHKHYLSTRDRNIHPPPAQPIPQSIPLPIVSAYSTSMHSKSDEDDGDDEALCLNLRATTRCRGQNSIDQLNRSKTIAVGSQHQHHKRPVRNASIRIKPSGTQQEGISVKEGSKEQAQKRRSGVVYSPRWGSRSNTADSSTGTETTAGTELMPAKDRQHEKRGARYRENTEQKRYRETEWQRDAEGEKLSLPTFPPVAR